TAARAVVPGRTAPKSIRSGKTDSALVAGALPARPPTADTARTKTIASAAAGLPPRRVPEIRSAIVVPPLLTAPPARRTCRLLPIHHCLPLDPHSVPRHAEDWDQVQAHLEGQRAEDLPHHRVEPVVLRDLLEPYQVPVRVRHGEEAADPQRFRDQLLGA